MLAAVADHLTNAEIGARLFISVRTVESHVSSLLRKLRVDDRRALAAMAGTLRVGPETALGRPDASAGGASRLPSPLTPFVGRVAERAALAEALEAHRLITAIGPGGVGKTRLALKVAADVAGRFAGGAWFIDLVPITDQSMIAQAIASELGLGEHQDRSAEDSVSHWLLHRRALVVLDNCEHLLDGVGALLERLLAGCPRLTVLATSRARLLVPFEWVFPVPGLSVETVDGRPSDAVELFAGRAAGGGMPIASDDGERVAAICRGLDGMALAIELAAARFPSLGLDGLETGLGDRLGLLTGGARADDRHRSLRSALDWSYALLDDAGQAVLRRVSVFAAPFTSAAAEEVLASWPPVAAGAVPVILAGLADQSLLSAIGNPGGTRYRMLETIRQYGADRLADAGELMQARSRHLRWGLETGNALGLPRGDNDGAWTAEFDQVADELRGALGWAAASSEFQPQAHQLAIRLAELSFARGTPGESQRRYEQAAGLAAADGASAEALRNAAGAAESRHFGNEALRLHRAAADAALRAGDHAAAAWDLAVAAELIYRQPGLMATPVPASQGSALLAEARMHTLSDPAAQARVLAAESFAGDDREPVTAQLAERSAELARQAGDPLTESAALDRLTSIHLTGGEVHAAAATALLRAELLVPLPVTAVSGLEHSDALHMATECAIAVGDLRAARKHAERIRDLPFHREEGQLAAGRLAVVAALEGELSETIALASRFREGWERAGRPRADNLTRSAQAAAAVHGLCGNADARDEWLDIVETLATPERPMSQVHVGQFFEALLLLHRGLPERAARLMDTPPEQVRAWSNIMWRPWYAALWAEAAVAAGHRDAGARLDRARVLTAGNLIAAALVDRAAVLLAGDRGGLGQAAAALAAAGARYQWARTLVLMGGTWRAQGESELTAMGAATMVWPAESG